MTHPFAQCILPVSHLVAFKLSALLSAYCSVCVQVILILLNNALKPKSSDVGNVDMPKRSHFLSEKEKTNHTLKILSTMRQYDGNIMLF